MRKIAASLLLLACGSTLSWAASTGSVTASHTTPAPAASPAAIQTLSGRVLDPSGAVITGADITLTNTSTGVSTHITSDADGGFSISGLPSGTYSLQVSKTGFTAYQRQGMVVSAGQSLTVTVTLSVSAVGQSVIVRGGELAGATTQPSQQQVLESNQSIRVIDRKQMDMVGPVAGGAQVISVAPGALVTGYGNSGGTKYTITLNGLNQGWGGYGGYTGGASLGVTFDGVPIVDPATDLWPSATIPENRLIQNTNVTYGPGNPADRWYTNMGGSIEFTPLQPTIHPHIQAAATYGSYQQKEIFFSADTGLHHGWSAVFAGGTGKGDDFRNAPDGFNNPSKDWAAQAKAIKTFNGNSLELGGYYAYAGGYRSQVIPIAANPYITMAGASGGQVYSQQTSGYYSTLPFNAYNKYDVNEMGLIYARENINLDQTTSIQNLSWYTHIRRLHARYNDVFQDQSGTDANQQQNEFNDPHTNTLGERFLLTKTLPWNTVTAGGYYIHALYNSRNNFYGPAWGGSGSMHTVNVGGKIRSSYFNQNDFSLFLQDDIHPVSYLHVTPGIRYVGFSSSFYNAVNQDFSLAPGAVLSTTCRYGNFGGTKGNVNVQDACPGAYANRSGVEPSVDVAIIPRPWLNIYGGFQEALRSPELGGGGGIFQSVDPASYHLERSKYYQFGAKFHPQGGPGFLSTMILGAAFYHEEFLNQEIDTTLANGDTFDANGSSVYKGVNIFFDDDPTANLHLFANANVEAASYTTYVTGGIIYNGQATCNPPSGAISGCLDYSGYPVSYVPNSTLNAGAYFNIHATDTLTIQPTAAFQFIGSQHLFDNCAEVAGACTAPAPSKSQTISPYATFNLGARVPYKHFDINFAALNVLNKQYNIFEYVSAGSYFNTASIAPTGSPYAYNYITAYPGAPVTAYGSVSYHF